MWNTNIPKEEAERCLLCPEGPCTAACPHGLDPAGLLELRRAAGAGGPGEDPLDLRLRGAEGCGGAQTERYEFFGL